jgi:Glyoxalase-like domain
MLSDRAGEDEVDRQLPDRGEIFLDHVGHFVRDPKAAADELARAGFSPTPVSVQVNHDGKGGESPTGTGNICAMLSRGYVECLFKTADTALGHELDKAMERYSGLHLVAFAVQDPEAAHARLQGEGFRMRPLVSMQRPVMTETGPDVAAFTVVRVERGEMAEGRIQMLRHRTEHTVWQPRWLAHPNGAVGLVDLVIETADPEEAAGRYARFLGRPSTRNAFGHAVRLDRGRVQLVAREVMRRLRPNGPDLGSPFIGLYAIRVRSLEHLERTLLDSGLPFGRRDNVVFAPFPEQLGVGTWAFAESPADLPWRAA